MTNPLNCSTIKDFTPTHSYANRALQCVPILGFFLSRIQMQQDLARGFSEAALSCRAIDSCRYQYISGGLGALAGTAILSFTPMLYLGLAILILSTLIMLFTCMQHYDELAIIDMLIRHREENVLQK